MTRALQGPDMILVQHRSQELLDETTFNMENCIAGNKMIKSLLPSLIYWTYSTLGWSLLEACPWPFRSLKSGWIHWISSQFCLRILSCFGSWKIGDLWLFLCCWLRYAMLWTKFVFEAFQDILSWHGQAPVWFMRDEDIRVKAVWALLGVRTRSARSATGSLNQNPVLSVMRWNQSAKYPPTQFLCVSCVYARLYEPFVSARDPYSRWLLTCVCVLLPCGLAIFWLCQLAGSMQLFVEGLAFFFQVLLNNILNTYFFCLGAGVRQIDVCMRIPALFHECFAFPWSLVARCIRIATSKWLWRVSVVLRLWQSSYKPIFFRQPWIPAWSLGCIFSTAPKQSLLFPQVRVCACVRVCQKRYTCL